MPAAGQQTLTDNFRSQLQILQFTNALLQKHMVNYAPLTNGLQPVGDHACVEFLWSPLDGEKVDEAHRAEANQIARRIAKMIATKEQVVTVRPEDGRRRCGRCKPAMSFCYSGQ